MSVYLNENEEEAKRKEIEEYDRERQAQIEEARVNGKARRMRQDKVFQKILAIVWAVIIIALVVSWALIK